MIRERGPRALIRVLPALLAGYELRRLLAEAGHLGGVFGTISAHPGLGFATLAAALVAAALLRESGRGLRHQLPRPQRTGAFAGLWLLSSAAVMFVLSCHGLLHGGAVARHVTEGRAWMTVDGDSLLASLLVGFAVAASVGCARRILRTVARWRHRPHACPVAALGPIRVASPGYPRQATFVDSWSSRGPPVTAATLS